MAGERDMRNAQNVLAVKNIVRDGMQQVATLEIILKLSLEESTLTM
jgi:hypothetical protein